MLQTEAARIRAAERKREQRQRRGEAGEVERDYHTPGNRMPTRWQTGEFVAVDGEGFSEGEPFRITIGDSGNTYTGQRHYYAYLAASDGSEVYAERGRLSLEQCLDFMCGIKERNPNAIVVVFSGGYDICHLVAHHLTQAQIKQLIQKNDSKGLDINTDDYQYRLEYRARKSFTIRRWPRGVAKYSLVKGKYKLSCHTSVVIWDVWGFFQDSFVGVLEKWLKGKVDHATIERMKAARSGFQRSDIEEIRHYNHLEVKYLAMVMDQVRAAIDALGLKISRWDGAGSIAAAMMAKHGVRKHMQAPPEPVFEAARHAYSGGHIEVCKIGYHDGPVYHYDITSAYPDIFRRLISLTTGFWKHGTGTPPDGFTVVKIKYHFDHGKSFYPLFFREQDGSILYPRRGVGWYWRPEYESALLYCELEGALIFEVLEWWHFDGPGERPFAWVEDYFQKRQEYISSAEAMNVISGEEKIIKLGLNSLYGKSCQQVGWKRDNGKLKLPGYFQLEWAGYVTSGCRAAMMRAAVQNPRAIIGFATDGLFSTAPLDLETPAVKTLGTWEYKIHDGITMVMPGVYWLHDGEKVKHYSRGFDKAEMSDAEFIHQAWREKKPSVAISVTRLIGLGSACTSPDFWRMRGCFVTSRRTLALDGDNSKRYPVALHRCRPERGLVDTIPRDQTLGDNRELDDLISAPYSVAWLDGAAEHGPEDTMIDEWEQIDAENA